MNMFSFWKNWLRRAQAHPRSRSRAVLNLEQLESRWLLSANPVAAYSFDEGSGSILHDLSGNGNNGIISNATWSTAGKYGDALKFSGAANSLVTINDTPTLDLTNGMTLEAWVDPTSMSASSNGWSAAVAKEHRNSSNPVSYALYAANGSHSPPTAHILVTNGDKGTQGGSQLSPNQWAYLTATYNGGTLRLYVNGTQVSSRNISGNIMETGDPLRIGGDLAGQMFAGLIDNVRIYNYARTQAQILTDMTTPVTAYPDELNNLNVPPLPAPTGTVVNVATVGQLQAAVANLQSGQTIVIAKGTYNLTGTLAVPQGISNVTIRGATNNRDDVIISGNGMSGTILYGIWVGNVQGITIADLTLKNFVDHAIIFNAGAQAPVIYNVHLIDSGEQLVQVNPDGAGGGVNNGILEYSVIGYTTNAPTPYTNGIDIQTGANWIISDNVFQSITAVGALAGPAVLIWNGSSNCTTENNTFINDQREIAYGLSQSPANDNSGGIIENNFIYRSGTQHGDVAIGVWNSPNTEVAYNTVVLNGDYVHAVEYRFATTTGVKILYNLTDEAIVSRDGATATVTGNVTNALASWFFNESVGDLHLTAAATAAIGHGVYLPEAATDYNGQSRPATKPTDVGADEYAADTGPRVTSVTPANGATDVSTTTAITVTFSEAVDPRTITTSTFELLDPQSNVVAATVTDNPVTNTATLTPTSALAANVTYTVLLEGGNAASVVKDMYGIALGASFTSSFTTDPVHGLTLSPATLSSATANSAYSATLSATGGSGAYTFAVTSGSLPSWLTLNASTGVLSGTPTTTGTSSFTITATDSNNSSLTGSQGYTLTVNAASSLTVSPATLASVTANSAFSATVSATGGSGTYTFAVTAGSLPSGLALNTSSGVLSGTPTTAGTYSFTITATDSNISGLTGSQGYTLTVNPASTLTVSPATLANATANSAYTVTESATGGSGTYTFAVTSGSLPSWLSLNASTGVLSGTPTITETTSFTITATDSNISGLTGSQTYTLTVNAASSLTVSPAALSSATANSAYSATLSATGGSGTYTFAVTSGSLPSWLALNTSTGVLSGTPTTTGTYSFTITASDSNISGLTGSQGYTLTVNHASSLTVSPAALSSVTANSAFSVTVGATGGSGAYTFAVTAGSLPSGLALSTSSGVLSGTPTTAGTYSFTITATDSNISGLTGSQGYSLTVNPASSLTVSPATLSNATANSAYSATVSATGGSGAYAFAVTSGSLPSWLSLNGSTGVLSGTPTTTGTSSFTITATDSNISGLTGSQSYTLTVNHASSLTVSPAALSSATANSAYSATLSTTGGSGTYTFAVTSGSLPSWLALNTSTGVLSGTPTTTGTYSFTITASDSNISGLTGSQGYSLTVNAASSLTVSPATLSNATANSAYSATVSATGGSGTYTFAVTSGSLPSWLSLNASTGALSGTPTTTGTSSFTITATDSNISGLTGSQGYSLTVNAASSLTVSPATLSNATANSAYSATVSATGGSGTYTFAVTSGSLPSWLSLNASTGALSGTPTTTGTSSFTITATDSNISGLTGGQAYTLTVNHASSLTVSPATLSSATANSAYSATLSATGGSGTYTFAVTSGSLPSWLSLNASSGVLSGTPSTTGTFSFTITASDSNISGLTGSQGYTLTVNAASSLTVSPATLSSATANSAYSVTVSATGGSGTYTFAVTSGSLPSWLSLNASSGALSGTPTTTGTSSFTLTATDSNISGLTGSQAYTLTVNAASSLTVSPATLSSATVNSAYSVTVSATGGSGTYTFAVTSGSLPSWLSLNASSGTLSGTPTATGTSSFTLTATDSNISDLAGSQAYTLTVNAASSLTVSPATLSNATANSAYSATVSATGGSGSYTFAVTSGSLPSWLSLNASSGVLSGTPTTMGTSSFTITATDSNNSGLTGSQSYTLNVNAASSLTVSPASLSSATANSAYSATVSATGGSGTYTFAVTSGSLPSWLTLNASSGVLKGTPTTTGTYSFTITATDSNISGLTGSQAYTLTVNAASSLTVSPATLSSATANSAYSATVSATGGSGTYTFSVTSGSLPSWLTLNASSGVLKGTPTTTGTYSFTITATDSNISSLTGSQAYTLTVNAASSLTVSPATLSNATANSAYSATVSATGGSGSYTFAVTSGSLPSWLSLNTSSGVLSGTPTTTGTSSFTITATDSNISGLTGKQSYTLNVNAASSLTVSPASLSSATANSAYSATVSATGGSGTYTFAVTSGSLPSWLTLNASSGVLKGTPTTTGTYSFTITATDSNINGLTGSHGYTLTVNPASSLTVSPASLSSATFNSAYTVTVSATGGSGTYTFAVTSGSLPAGLSLNGGTGVLSGTPTTAGTSSFTITATDSNISGLTGSQAYTLTVGSNSNMNPPPLPAPTGTVINVSTGAQLQAAVAALQSGQTIVIAKGTYNLTDTLWVPQGINNIAIRGATNNRDDVVINGNGMSGTILYGIWVGNVQGITIADLTLKNFVDHAIILNAGAQSPVIYNVHLIDCGEQFVKSNPDTTGGGVNNGIIEYSVIGYTTNAPTSYTNGVDVHTGQNWIIRNNLFQNILAQGALAGPAVLAWNGSKNFTVENNTFINCQREIAFGLNPPTTITDDNSGGIIANNFIYRSGSQHGDVAIGVWNSPNSEVAYNTVILNGDYPNAVEYRFATTTGVQILYNLTDAAITQRDGATATVTGNVTSGVQVSWFANESTGDLHLTAAATGAIGHGVYLPEVATDYNGQGRPPSGPTDVGADEYKAVTGPTVTAVSPANSATEVITTTSVTVAFSEAVDPSTITTATFELLDPQSNVVSATVTDNPVNNTATLTPTSALATNTTYTVVLKGGSTGAVVKDMYGYNLATSFSSSFTTDPPQGLPPASGLTVNPASLPSATANSAYSATLSATGGSGTYTFAVTSGSLPSWLALNASTGVLSGTPTTTGTATFTITATDSANSSLTGSQGYTLTVNAASSLTVSPATLPAATANSAFSVTVSATGGSGSYSFAVTAGSLPSWLALNASSGSLSGTPTTTGTYSFTITATDSSISGLTGSQAYTLTVNPASSLTVSPATLPSASVNNAFSVTVSATGGSGTYTFAVSSGSLPSWLALNASTGVLSGTPKASGTYTFTIKATDSNISGLTGSQGYTLTVSSQEPLIHKADLQYLGAFRLPGISDPNVSGDWTYDYGGTALAFNPANNSLFLDGITFDQAISEISIPQSIVNSTNLNALSVATVLQPPREVLGSLPNNPNTSLGGEKIGGLAVVNGKLIGTDYVFYDAGGAAVDSHFTLSSLNLATATLGGMYQVGTQPAGLVAGYMAPIPSEWQGALGAPYLTGQADIPIIARTSSGPAAFGFDPSQLGSSVAPATPYVWYDSNNHPLGPYIGPANPLQSGNGLVNGVVFAPGTSSVLFFGSTGTNYEGYGLPADWNDPYFDKGPHSLNGQYAMQVWAYNASDFVAAKQGTIQPWQVVPYDVWNFDVPITTGSKRLGGVAFDPATGRVYVSVMGADQGYAYHSLPLIEVYQLKIPSGAAQPASPQIGTVAATPTSVDLTGTPVIGAILAGTSVDLWAGNVYAINAGTSISRVAFYLDSNNDGVFQPGTDQLLGYGTASSVPNASHNWMLTISTTGLTSGSHTIFAQALGSDGLLSDPLAMVLTIK
jgi:hypothetical protein